MSKKTKERYLAKNAYFSFLKETAIIVDSYVKEYILNIFRLQPAIADMLLAKYRFGVPQLRPASVRLAYELVGGQDWLKIVPACASLEMRDTAYYCYDDVADLNKSPKLFLLANAFVTASNQMMTEMENSKALLELFKLDENNIASGFIELENVISEDYYFKKAVGFNFWENAFRVGAILGNCEESMIERVGEIGKNIGIAYIVANDTWDFGKNLDDFSSGKYTLPIIWAMDNVIGNDNDVLKKFFGKKINENQKNEIRSIMVKSGAIEYGKKMSLNFCEEAGKLLNSFPPSKPREMIEFSMTMTQRNKHYASLEFFQRVNHENESFGNIHEVSSGRLPLIDSDYLDNHYVTAEKKYEEMVRSVGFQKGWSILDAGAGSGCFIPTLSKLLGEKGTIYAVDSDSQNVDFIRKRIDSNEYSCKVLAQLCDIKLLPFDSNSFDAIWCSNVFQYLTDEEKTQVLKEFRRVVRPGGLIAIKELDLTATFVGPDPIIFWHIFEKLKTSSVQIRSTLYTYNLPTLAIHCGLEVVDCNTFLVEKRNPLEQSDLPYLRSIMQSLGYYSMELPLTEQELLFVKKISDPNSPDYYLNSPDFYWREGFAIVVCRVPDN